MDGISAGSRSGSASTATNEEYTLAPVPETATFPAWRIGVMLLGANISLPVFVVGGQLGAGIGLGATAAASLWAGLILAAITGACAYAGARSRLTTYVLITNAFGCRGGTLVNALLSISAIGWFAVVVMLFAGTLIGMAGSGIAAILSPAGAIVGTMLMIATSLAGFRILNLFANITMPLKLLLLGWTVFAALHRQDMVLPLAAPTLPTLDRAEAIALIVGGWIVGATLSPDLSRFARRPSAGAWSCALALGVGYPLILIMTAIPAALTGELDMIRTMMSLGLGTAALTVILLAAWSSGASILYSGSLVIAAVLPRSRLSRITIAGAFVGLIFALSGVAGRVIPYLMLLSIAVPPIAGVYLARFFLDMRSASPAEGSDWSLRALGSCVLAIVFVGLGGHWGLALSGISAIDSLAVAAIAYLISEISLAIAGRGFLMNRGRESIRRPARSRKRDAELNF